MGSLLIVLLQFFFDSDSDKILYLNRLMFDKVKAYKDRPTFWAYSVRKLN